MEGLVGPLAPEGADLDGTRQHLSDSIVDVALRAVSGKEPRHEDRDR